MKSIVTEYDEICFLCGRRAEAEHHLVFGIGSRDLAERDGLKVPVCNRCHNTGALLDRVHENPVAEKMSKMIGQLAWEKEMIASMVEDADKAKKEARKKFNDRYGKSYL